MDKSSNVFQFRFETLLMARQNAEECLQKELSEARRRLAAEQFVLREKKGARRQCLQERRRRQRQGFRGSDMLLFEAYLHRLNRDIDGQRKRVAQVERQVGQTRLALIEAMKKRKILETLKEKDQASHIRTAAERERKFIDEAAAWNHFFVRRG
jgi:flagellar FliJ protein